MAQKSKGNCLHVPAGELPPLPAEAEFIPVIIYFEIEYPSVFQVTFMLR